MWFFRPVYRPKGGTIWQHSAFSLVYTVPRVAVSYNFQCWNWFPICRLVVVWVVANDRMQGEMWSPTRSRLCVKFVEGEKHCLKLVKYDLAYSFYCSFLCFFLFLFWTCWYIAHLARCLWRVSTLLMLSLLILHMVFVQSIQFVVATANCFCLLWLLWISVLSYMAVSMEPVFTVSTYKCLSMHGPSRKRVISTLKNPI